MQSTVASPGDVAAAARLFCGLADRTRLAIIRLRAVGEQRVSDIVDARAASQANFSGHLRCLKDHGLVIDRRAGQEASYPIAHPEAIDVLRSAKRWRAVTGPHTDRSNHESGQNLERS